ncbi:hypothetical protein [Archangium lipolyticum]|uniref:hypothetical protein n=1 Tax=Archangium lipolyticum TaxID=2970465 RepID=UPI00214A77F6|nr:hypothetical protein [Archangium lipolyticum]
MSLGVVATGMLLTALAAAPERAPSVYALIVSNNQSYKLARPALRYADDDGAKYHEVFSLIAGAGHVTLLGDFDRDTERQFPELAAAVKEPSAGNVREAARTVAAAVRADRAAGREVDFFFVFAGHGDVDGGRGFLELSDAAFDASALEAVLREVGATRSHVILDSCNSFFVISPRKAGGRRFSTPADVSSGVAQRVPNVGVFLSTSAEAEVYEWSELQSGVFSHAVRSGLLGAADANADGRITYRELEAFVSVASSAVPNPLFRPKVFARGPGLLEEAVLVDLRGVDAPGLELPVSEPVRVTLRDTSGLRWLDANKERGVALRLLLPPRLASGMEVERRRPGVGTERYEVASAARGVVVRLEDLSPTPAPLAGRGAQDQLRRLFDAPFGPAALAAWDAARAAEPPPVFGISEEDRVRMRLVVETFAAVEQDRMNVSIITSSAAALSPIVVGTYTLLSEGPRSLRGWGPIMGGLVLGGLDVLTLSRLERPSMLLEEFADDSRDPGLVVARTDWRLNRFLAQERRLRRKIETRGWLLLIASGALLTLGELGRLADLRRETIYFFEANAMGVGISAASHLIQAYFTRRAAERLIDLWRRDPGLRELPRVSLVPLEGGAALAVHGSF